MYSKRRHKRKKYYSKDWNSERFSAGRGFKEEQSWIDEKISNLEAGEDGLAIFLQDREEEVPSCQVEEVAEFCQGTSWDAVTQGTGSAGRRRAAWLDVRSAPRRSRNGGLSMKYQNPLTATGLYKPLQNVIQVS